GITVGLSTGTSGKRGLFLVAETERAQWAALVITRIIKPELFKKKRVAFFLRANSNLYSSVNSSLLDFHYFDIFRPIEQLLAELQAFQPHIVAAQPSVLMEIAKAQFQKGITISPEQIISFAEVLYPDDKQFIRQQFSSRFTEVYQCTEGLLGISCEHGTIHLNEDFIHFDKEIIEGRMFYPIVTDFTRSSQPVVKYKLNDVLVEREMPCPCGSQLLGIEQIIGRDDDVLEFMRNGEVVKIYPDLISRRIALASETPFNYQIRQKNNQLLAIYTDAESNSFKDFKTLMIRELNKLFHERSLTGIQFEFSNYLVHVQGNKNRRITKDFS
ncbi:MAG: F390 synthetase-related protein, partial [Bacteroidia bacterium]